MALSILSSGNYGDSAATLADSHTLASGSSCIVCLTQSRNATAALDPSTQAPRITPTAGGATTTSYHIGVELNHQTGRYMDRWMIDADDNPGAGSYNVAAGAQASADRIGVTILEIGGSVGVPTFSSAPTGVIGSGATANLAVTAGANDLVIGFAQRGAAIANSYTPDGTPALTELFDAAAVAGLGCFVGYGIGTNNADVTATAGGGNIGIVAVVITEISSGTEYEFTGTGLSGESTLGTGALQVEHTLTGVGLSGDSTLGSGVLVVEHAFTGVGLSGDAAFGTGVLAVDHTFAGVGLSSNTNLGVGALLEAATFTGISLSGQSTLGSGVLSVEHTFAGVGLSSTTELGVGTLDLNAVFTGVGISADGSLGVSTLSVEHTFVGIGLSGLGSLGIGNLLDQNFPTGPIIDFGSQPGVIDLGSAAVDITFTGAS